MDCLPGEIVFHIAKFCAPSDYYNFALAYRRAYEVGADGHYRRLYIIQNYTSDSKYETLTDGTMHGEYIKYDGFNICETSYYHKGNLHGLNKLYTNGALVFIGCYVNGTRNGLFTWYYTSGVIKSTEYYVYGTPVGLLKRYYSNGNLRSVSEYVNGWRKLVDYYREGGKSIEYKYSKCGVRTVIMYYEDGSVITVEGNSPM